jgi:hypothetical protein
MFVTPTGDACLFCRKSRGPAQARRQCAIPESSFASWIDFDADAVCMSALEADGCMLAAIEEPKSEERSLKCALDVSLQFVPSRS